MPLQTHTITPEQYLAALLLNADAVSVPVPDEAKRLLQQHRNSGASEIADMAAKIYARRKEYRLCGQLRRIGGQGMQKSLIRGALVLIFTAAAADEAAFFIDGLPEEVLYAGEDELSALLA